MELLPRVAAVDEMGFDVVAAAEGDNSPEFCGGKDDVEAPAEFGVARYDVCILRPLALRLVGLESNELSVLDRNGFGGAADAFDANEKLSLGLPIMAENEAVILSADGLRMSEESRCTDQASTVLCFSSVSLQGSLAPSAFPTTKAGVSV